MILDSGYTDDHPQECCQDDNDTALQDTSKANNNPNIYGRYKSGFILGGVIIAVSTATALLVSNLNHTDAHTWVTKDATDSTQMNIALDPTSTLPITPQSTPSSTASPTAVSRVTTKGCLPDRFDNEEMDLTVDPSVNFSRLYPGQFLCSRPYSKKADSDKIPQRYRFGITEDTGNLVWQDTVTNETIVVMDNPNSSATLEGVYLTLTIDATIKYHYNNTLVEQIPTSNLKHPMQSAPTRCLSNHDCPYFHMHSDGVMVLNYIAADGTGWEERNFLKAYDI